MAESPNPHDRASSGKDIVDAVLSGDAELVRKRAEAAMRDIDDVAVHTLMRGALAAMRKEKHESKDQHAHSGRHMTDVIIEVMDLPRHPDLVERLKQEAVEAENDHALSRIEKAAGQGNAPRPHTVMGQDRSGPGM